MLHKLVIVPLIAISFLVLIQLANGVFRFLFPVLGLYFAAVMAYNYFFLKRNKFFSFWSWLRPLFFFLALAGIYLALPHNFARGLFLVFAVIAIYYVERALLVASEQALFLETLFSYFGLCLTVFAANTFLFPLNSLVLLVFAIFTFLIARSSLDYIPQNSQQKNFYSALIAFGVLEFVWALIFSPFHFTINTAIIFNVFYVLWIIVYYYLFHNLTFKKISFHIIFSSLIVVIAILSTPWK